MIELYNYRKKVNKMRQNAQKELNNAKNIEFPIGYITEKPEDPDPNGKSFGQSATGLLKKEAAYVIFHKQWDSYSKWLKSKNQK